MGYGTHSGGLWVGTYECFPVDDFVVKSLAGFTKASEFDGRVVTRPHVPKVIRLDSDGWHFPLQGRYKRCNATLEGREAFKNDAPLMLDELASISYCMERWCTTIMRDELAKAGVPKDVVENKLLHHRELMGA